MTTTITPSQVQHIAHLARLELTEDEIAHYSQQLSAILEHFARLQTLDASSAAVTASQSPTPLRPDVARPSLSRPEILRNAPAVESEQFRVPPVFE
jgi:aspartyl-tRNA(Asn)/glutamyl-tRNA(Gln) amidotransferase subunit C